MNKNKAIVTFLGLLSYTKKKEYIENNEIKKEDVPIEKKERPLYYFENKLQYLSSKRERYLNTLPLILETFKEYRVIPIATKESLEKQKKVLEFLDLDISVLENKILVEEKKYEQIFEKIATILDSNEFDEIIIDLTHGYRHMPILAIVNIIIQSIKDLTKIKHILFAKEVEKYKKYEIIDLIDYIDLANLAYILVNFEKTYTIAGNIDFENKNFKKLTESLNEFSKNFLANSFKNLIEDEEESIINTILQSINSLEKTSKVEYFSLYLNDIKEHLKQIKEISKKKEEYIQLFEYSKIFNERFYYLNSITLLNESIGLFCTELLSSLDNKIKNHIQIYKDNENDKYKLASESRIIIKQQENFNGSFLFSNKIKITASQKNKLQKQKKDLKEKINPKILQEIKDAGFEISLKEVSKKSSSNIKNIIIDKLQKIDKNFLNDLISLIKDIEQTRNNLAHGNSSEKIEKIKEKLDDYIDRFKQIQQKKRGNILHKDKNHNITIKQEEKVMPNGEIRIVKSLK